ncbi:hypothetical protein BpHYR1_030468 [Brachionus plicatilis]|uniref:Uncharacterized protein n=1 Tax=Brachionus plicatilis TaxID=10195 RepID=A0A3M7RWT0_BRAPC|nr:hypothetical protein BpHYR1_030468 [Brachionus plicatilis]
MYILLVTFPTKSFNQDNTFIEFKTTKGKLCIGYLTEKYRFKYESKIIGYISRICNKNESSGCLATIKKFENTITKQPITDFGHQIGNKKILEIKPDLKPRMIMKEFEKGQ